MFDTPQAVPRQLNKESVAVKKDDATATGAEDMGTKNFKNVFDNQCYIPSSNRTKVSVLRCIKRYLEVETSQRLNPGEMNSHRSSRTEVHNLGIALAVEGSR